MDGLASVALAVQGWHSVLSSFTATTQMNKSLLVLILLTGAHALSHAALQGRDTDGNAANGVEAYYDTQLGVTWWADAGLFPDLSYSDAVAAAAGATLGGVSGWRLPGTAPVNGTGFSYDQGSAYATDGTKDLGYNIVAPGNELSYMYYVNLQGSAGTGLYGDVTEGGATILGLTGGTYWTGTVANDGKTSCQPASVYQGCRWVFESGLGLQDYYTLNQPGVGPTLASAWLVHDGDVFAATAVPEPETWAMMLAGLGLVCRFGRTRRA